MRARIIYNDDLDISEIYEDLILKYEGRVCTRSGFHPYNVYYFQHYFSPRASGLRLHC